VRRELGDELVGRRPVAVVPVVIERLIAERGITAAAQVYVCEPPLVTPTGRYLGSIGFQRLLRRPPAALAGECIETSVFVRPELTERELAARIAAYNMVSVAVCDENGRLVGAVTVDDVLDHLLPADWRKTGG